VEALWQGDPLENAVVNGRRPVVAREQPATCLGDFKSPPEARSRAAFVASPVNLQGRAAIQGRKETTSIIVKG